MSVKSSILSMLGNQLMSKPTEDEASNERGEKKIVNFAKTEQTLQAHDRQHHPKGFNPKTMTCKFRDKLLSELEGKNKENPKGKTPKAETSISSKKPIVFPSDAVDLIYATSDVHHSGIESITNKTSGTIVLAGDFMEKAKKQEHFPSAQKWWAKKFIPWCNEHKDQKIVIIGGNCDKWLYQNRDSIKWPSNVTYLDDSEAMVNGMRVYGTSWCPRNMNGAWEVKDDVLEKEFAKIPEGLDVLVTHVPPKGDGYDLDYDTSFNSHFGSEALTKAILEKKPKIVLCGHVHSGSHKPIKIGDSIVMNVSRIDDDRYEKAFHGRKIGIERTENGLGFIVDMDDEGKFSLGKKEDVPQPILELRDALREAALSINKHIDWLDFTPDKKKIKRVKEAFKKAKVPLKTFAHPKKVMIERSLNEFVKSIESGYTKRMSRVGKLYDGDANKIYKPSYSSGQSSPLAFWGMKWQPSAFSSSHHSKPQGQSSKHSKQSGMSIDDILNLSKAKHTPKQAPSSTMPNDGLFDEFGLPL